MCFGNAHACLSADREQNARREEEKSIYNMMKIPIFTHVPHSGHAVHWLTDRQSTRQVANYLSRADLRDEVLKQVQHDIVFLDTHIYPCPAFAHLNIY
jgi:hypothetical protein